MESPQGSEQQFTVFYSGGVNVFHHVPAHKARAIMLLLSNDHGSSAGNSVFEGGINTLVQTPQPQLSKSGEVDVGCAEASYLPASPPAPAAMPTTDKTQITHFIKKQAPLTTNKRSQAELPFARKASLARFLEKRKDRALEAMRRNEDVRACAEGDAEGHAEALGSPCKRMKP